MWVFNPENYIKDVLNPALQPFGEKGDLPDYFERFALSTDVSDIKEIELAIQTVSSSWSKTKQNPKYQKLCNLLVEPNEIKRARRVLLDPQARSEARALAEQAREKRKAARFESLDRSIALAAGKGYITPQERSALLVRYRAQGLSESEILDRLRRIRVQEIRTSRVPEGLPKEVRGRIREDLKVVGCKNLYEFLSVAPGSGPELKTAYEKTEREWRSRPSDHRRTSANNLLGIVKTHLIDGNPKNYEYAQAFELLEQIRPDLQLAGTDKRIGQREFRELVKRLREIGVDAAKATDFILAEATDMGISVEWSASEDSVFCRSCARSFPADKVPATCDCGKPLRVDCPNCSQHLSYTLNACGKCGFVLDDQHKVGLLVRQGELALQDGMLSDALKAASGAERLVGTQGKLHTLVRSLFQKIETRRQKLQEVRQEVEKCLSERHLSAAQSALSGLRSESPEYQFRDGQSIKDIVSRVEAQFGIVAGLLAEARKLEAHEIDKAVLTYNRVRLIDMDNREAQEGLARFPPQPPGIPKAVLVKDSVRIEWSESPGAGSIEYIVVRGNNVAPTSPLDGELVARTRARACRDDKPPAGITAFYSVFADRGSAVSQGTVTPGIHIALEVRNLELTSAPNVVNGKWEAIAPGGRVRITRKEGGDPERPGDGVEIVAASPQTFVDTNVVNGKRYHYRISVEYRFAGKTVLTPGLVESAAPNELPVQIRDLQLGYDSTGLKLTWLPPSRGVVAIYRLDQPPPVPAGSVKRLSDLRAWGAPLNNLAAGASIDSAPKKEACYYVPVTFNADLAMIGQWRKHVPLSDVTGMIAEDFGDYFLLRWRWPADCVSVKVVWCPDRYPLNAVVPGASSAHISRGEYDAQGGFRIDHPEDRSYWFVVFASKQVDDEQVFSPGFDPGCRAGLRTSRKVEVSYSVERRTLFRSKLTIRFFSSSSIQNLPEIVVVGRFGEIQPTRAEDGDLLLELGGLTIGPGEVVSRDFKISHTPIYVRAFFRQMSAYSSFHLADPPASQLRMR